MFIRSQSITVFVVFILFRRIASINCSSDKQEVEEKSNDGLYISSQRQDNSNTPQHDLDYNNAQNETMQENTDKDWSNQDGKSSEEVSPSDTIESSDRDKDDFEVSDSILKASHKSLIQRFTYGSRKSDRTLSPPLLTSLPDTQDIERRKEPHSEKLVKNKSSNKNHGSSNQSEQSENEFVKRARNSKLRFFKNQSKKIPSLSNLLTKPKKSQESSRGNDTIKGNGDKIRNKRNKQNSPLSNEQIEQALALESFMNPLGSHSLLPYPPHSSPPGFLPRQHHQVFPFNSHHGLLGPNQHSFLNQNLVGGLGQEASVNHHLYHNPQVHGTNMALAYGNVLHPTGNAVLNQLQKTAETSMPAQLASNTQNANRGSSGTVSKNNTALNAAAAAVLLGERAKTLLNQMTMSNAAAVAAAAAAVAAKNSNLLAEANPNNSSSDASSSSTAKVRPATNLDSTIQSNTSLLAPPEPVINEDTWQSMTLRQHAANSNGEVMALAPTMMLEHTDEAAGPLDFDTQLVGSQTMHSRNPVGDVPGDGEDDLPAPFYTEDANAKMTHAISHSNLQRPPMLMPHNPMDFYEDNPAESQEIIPDNYNERQQQPLPPVIPYGVFPMGGNSGGPMHMAPPMNNNHNRHESSYPDSINAIKQKTDSRDDDYRSHNQDSNDDRDRKHNKDNLINLVRDRLRVSSSANNDQIKELIKELQELDLDNDSGRKSSSDKGSSVIDFDDYEDLLGKDDEEDRRKALRRKIIAKIRSKYERQAKKVAKEFFNGGKSNDDSIRIPLHALLLAALDRRASSSESSNRHIVLPDESESSNLVNDDQSRYIINDAQRQFAEDTSEMGPLLNATKLIESSVIQSSEDQQQSLNPVQQISTKELLPIESSLTLPSGPLSQNMNTSGIDISMSPLQMTVDNVQSSNNNNMSIGLASPKPTEQIDAHQQGLTQNNKTRRAPAKPANEGDFDLDEQAERYSRDDRRDLEPAWMRREDYNDHAVANNKRRRRVQNKSNDTMRFQDFEDDYDQLEKSARRKMRAKFRTRTKRPSNRSRKPNESSYLDDGQRFIDNVTRDASASNNSEVGPTDVDRNIANMDPESGDEKSHSRSDDKSARSARSRSIDYDDDYDDRMSRESGEDDYSGNDANDRKGTPGKKRSRKEGHSRSWKPNMIDDEVKRIEADARDKEDIRRGREVDPSNGDQTGDDNGEDNEEQESVVHEQNSRHNELATSNGEPKKNPHQLDVRYNH